jgi:hypothetical protein
MHFTKQAIIANKRDYKSCLASKVKELFVYKIDVKETIKGKKLYYNISRIRH